MVVKLPNKDLEWLTLAVGADKYGLALRLPNGVPVIIGKVEEVGKKWHVRIVTYHWQTEGQWKYLTKKVAVFNDRDAAMEFLADPKLIAEVADNMVVRKEVKKDGEES